MIFMWFTVGVLLVISSSKETKCFLIEEVPSFIRITVRIIDTLSIANSVNREERRKGKNFYKVFSARIVTVSVLLLLLGCS